MQMIIANRLNDGVVVFYAADGTWTSQIGEGRVMDDDADLEHVLELAKADEQNCIVIDPYLIEVAGKDGEPKPTSIREAIRAFGPTV